MKTLLTLLFSLTTTLAWAGGPHRHRHYHHGYNHWHWVAPALISGAVVYGLTRPVPPPSPVYYVQQPTVLPPPPFGYHYQQILDANCNCYRWVLIPS